MREKPAQYKEYQIEPISAALGETTVSAVLRLNLPENVWEVIVVFSYAPRQISMLGENVSAQLLDHAGASLEMLAHPAGPLVEVGGIQSRSANARFRFQAKQEEPAFLRVIYRGEQVGFKIVSA